RKAPVVTAGGAIEHLIHNSVDVGVAGMLERNAGRRRIRERAAGIVATLIAEARTGVMPRTDPVSARKSRGVLPLVGQKAQFRDDKGPAAKADDGAGGEWKGLIGRVAPPRIT